MAETERRKPIVLAMILCDQIIVEKGTEKPNLIGVFSVIFAKKFPAAHQKAAIYVALTEGQGDYTGRLRLVFAETEQELFRAEGPISLPNPLAVCELRFAVPVIPLPREGKYRLDFLCDDELCGSRRFVARQLAQGDAK